MENNNGFNRDHDVIKNGFNQLSRTSSFTEYATVRSGSLWIVSGRVERRQGRCRADSGGVTKVGRAFGGSLPKRISVGISRTQPFSHRPHRLWILN